MKKAKKTTAKRRAEPDELQQEFLDRIPAEQKDEKVINIIFDGPPSHESGRFVEVENDSGTSIGIGEWIDRADGYWALRITDTDFNALPPHRTDEKGGTQPPDEAQTEKLTISTFQKTHPSDADELRCLDCGAEMVLTKLTEGLFQFWCTHDTKHCTGSMLPTEAEAKATYRKLIDDRRIAEAVRELVDNRVKE